MNLIKFNNEKKEKKSRDLINKNNNKMKVINRKNGFKWWFLFDGDEK